MSVLVETRRAARVARKKATTRSLVIRKKLGRFDAFADRGCYATT